MPVQFKGIEYLVGPSGVFNLSIPGDSNVGTVDFANQKASVFRSFTTKKLFLVWQPLNSNFRAYAHLRTKEQLLHGWS